MAYAWQMGHRVWAAMAAAVLVGRPDPARAHDPGCGTDNSRNPTAGRRLGVFTGESRLSGDSSRDCVKRILLSRMHGIICSICIYLAYFAVFCAG